MPSKSICIIPARGGSKRIPRKNIKDFHGKPIIAYSIQTALKSGLFEEVMVSTDDKEIAEIATLYGANVPFIRSPKNSDDFATTYEVLEEVLESYEAKDSFFDYVCCLYATAPLVNFDRLKEAYHILIAQNKHSVIPIVPFSYPPQRSIKVNEDLIAFNQPEYEKTRSQDLEKYYHDAGQFYWSKTDVLIDQKTLLTTNSGFLELNDLEVQDIDTSVDWRLAELKYALSNEISK